MLVKEVVCGAECASDSDCHPYKCSTSDCKCIKECSLSSDCADGYCCLHEIDATQYNCVSAGTIIYYNGKSYLCDPPGWELKRESFSTSNSILTLVQNLFHSFPALKK